MSIISANVIPRYSNVRLRNAASRKYTTFAIEPYYFVWFHWHWLLTLGNFDVNKGKKNLDKEERYTLEIAALPKNHIRHEVGGRLILVWNQLQHTIVGKPRVLNFVPFIPEYRILLNRIMICILVRHFKFLNSKLVFVNSDPINSRVSNFKSIEPEEKCVLQRVNNTRAHTRSFVRSFIYWYWLGALLQLRFTHTKFAYYK